MKQLSAAVNWINLFLGRLSAWLLLASVLVSSGNAVLRKAFSIGSNAMLELQWYLIGTTVMLGAAWVLQENAHIRIEILTGQYSKGKRRLIELCGHLLMLIPFTGLMVWLSWPFFVRSYAQNEISLNTGGLLVWPMRGIIVFGFLMLLAQALSDIIKYFEPNDDADD